MSSHAGKVFNLSSSTKKQYFLPIQYLKLSLSPTHFSASLEKYFCCSLSNFDTKLYTLIKVWDDWYILVSRVGVVVVAVGVVVVAVGVVVVAGMMLVLSYLMCPPSSVFTVVTSK